MGHMVGLMLGTQQEANFLQGILWQIRNWDKKISSYTVLEESIHIEMKEVSFTTLTLTLTCANTIILHDKIHRIFTTEIKKLTYIFIIQLKHVHEYEWFF